MHLGNSTMFWIPWKHHLAPELAHIHTPTHPPTHPPTHSLTRTRSHTHNIIYVCMHACMHACMYVCMYVRMNVHICGCVCVYIYIYIYLHRHIYICYPLSYIYLPFHGFAGYASEHVPQNSGPIHFLMRICLYLSLFLYRLWQCSGILSRPGVV